MRVTELDIPGVLLIEQDVYRDERGWFLEFWNPDRATAPGLPSGFVQTNVAFSRRGVLRGLHFQQQPYAQGKLITALEGEIYDVAVDLRLDAPTFGRWTAFQLAASAGSSLYVPPGFAHGYQVVSETAHVIYLCTTTYRPAAERILAWNDAELAIDWPISDPVLSSRDRAAPGLQQVRAALASSSSPQ